jgi:hypothetical protein
MKIGDEKMVRYEGSLNLDFIGRPVGTILYEGNRWLCFHNYAGKKTACGWTDEGEDVARQYVIEAWEAALRKPSPVSFAI